MIPLIQNDGQLLLIPDFIAEDEAWRLCALFADELVWSSESVQIYGKSIQSPRLVSWYGDEEAIYRYSGVVHYPQLWHPVLYETKIRLESFTGQAFNSVLCNFYRDGNDSMGWHADNEKKLGINPFIGSMSLGETRTFRIRHRYTGEAHNIALGNGSLIIMAGRLQQYWRHCVPKSGKMRGARINLSFRKIVRSPPTQPG